MSSTKAFLIFLFIVFTCSSCLGKTSIPELTSVPTQVTQESYPYPSGGGNAGEIKTIPTAQLLYPMSFPTESILANLPQSLSVPQPQKDTGIVTGFLVTVANEPYIGAVYLAKAIPADQVGYPPLIAFSEQTDPKAVQSANGQFIFTDILPGEYAIVLWNPVSNLIIKKSGSEDFLLFKVEAGQVTDLGKVLVP